MRALVIVDVQNDFVAGSLAVPGAASAIRTIHEIAGNYSVVAATRDLHPADHCSFAENGGPWPSHCVQGSLGAQYCGYVDELVTPGWHFVKGYLADREEYSGAFALAQDSLVDSLRHDGWPDVDVVGLALDYCVMHTAIDLSIAGFHVRVIEDATAAVSPIGRKAAIAHLHGADVEVI